MRSVTFDASTTVSRRAEIDEIEGVDEADEEEEADEVVDFDKADTLFNLFKDEESDILIDDERIDNKHSERWADSLKRESESLLYVY